MRVFSNLAISIDGKIADLARPGQMLGTEADKKLMSVLRAQADVIVTGSTTLKVHPYTYKAKLKHLATGRRKNLRFAANAIITSSGKLNPDMPFWEDPDIVRFVFTSESGLKHATDSARERAFVVVCGEGAQVDLRLVLKRLRESGLKNILVEGGGELMATFLHAKLLQEINLTVTPWVIGGKANPTLVGGSQTLLPWTALKLVKNKKIKSELFLTYKVKGAERV